MRSTRSHNRYALGAALGAALFAGWVSWPWGWPGWALCGFLGLLAALWKAFRRGPDATPADLRNLRLRVLQVRLAKLLRGSPVWDDDYDRDEFIAELKRVNEKLVLGEFASMAEDRQTAALKEAGRLLTVAQRHGWMSDYCRSWSRPSARLVLPAVLGLTKFDDVAMGDNPPWRFELGHVQYGHTRFGYRPQQFEPHRSIIEEMWGGPVIIETAPDWSPGCVRIRPAPKLPAQIPLALPADGRVTLGTCLFSAEVAAIAVHDIPHLLVMGTSGFGKSVFLHQLVSQLVRCPAEAVEAVTLVDLKGGVEFMAYADADLRVRMVWRFEDVVKAVADLVALMEARQAEMMQKRWRTYQGKRVFFVVDEFAQIQLYPVEGKEGRQVHDRLLANLNRLSMLGRSAGIVLVAAIQKATADVMDSSFRANLQGQVCFRVSNRLAAASMFGSVDDLKLDPVTLPRGRFIFYDPTIGGTRYLQAHVVPEPMT
jgi:hypothetical protein